MFLPYSICVVLCFCFPLCYIYPRLWLKSWSRGCLPAITEDWIRQRHARKAVKLQCQPSEGQQQVSSFCETAGFLPHPEAQQRHLGTFPHPFPFVFVFFSASSRRQPLSTANRDEDKAFVTPQPRTLRNPKRAQKSRPRKKPIITFSSDEENSSEDGKSLDRYV